MKWAYGVTTVSQRLETLLPKTLDSLCQAGFPTPRLFVDGFPRPETRSPLPYMSRCPKIGAYGNWVLGLWELLLRNPDAERFAMFQDDLIASKRLRQYLEGCPYPDRG